MPERRLTVKQVAEQLGTGVLSVYRRIWSGEIPAVDLRQPGKGKPTYRVAQSAVDAYLAAHAINQPTRRAA